MTQPGLESGLGLEAKISGLGLGLEGPGLGLGLGLEGPGLVNITAYYAIDYNIIMFCACNLDSCQHI